jgi:pyruvate/2-oxoacid:ferredoxin oxidoreductase alpha subunit
MIKTDSMKQHVSDWMNINKWQTDSMQQLVSDWMNIINENLTQW